MRSRFRLQAGRVVEQLGAARLSFDLDESGGRLEMRLVRLVFLGIPCPRWLRPVIVAHETGEGARLHFHVQASVPGVGVVARYQGYLDLPD